MLNAIVRFSLRFRGIVVALACALMLYGLYSIEQARYDVFPEFAPPEVQIQTEAPGLSPEQVELLVTQPIENAVNGVSGIELLRSGSIQGLSVITAIFRANTNVYLDRQVVTERLSAITGQLPAGITPRLAPLTSSTGMVEAVGLTSKNRSLMEMRTAAEWTIRPRLLAVPGIAAVEIFGGQIQQLQIQFSPQKLKEHNLGINDVIAAARRATGIRGAGFVSTGNQRIVLQTEGQSLTPEELARTVVVHTNGQNVTLGDVAQVENAPAPMIGAGTVMGQPAVILMVTAQYGGNTLQLTQSVDSALRELQPALQAEGITLHTDIFRPATFIERALHNIRSSLLIGAILIVVVLSLFLANLRTVAISATAIPLSLIAAVIVLERFGFSLNTMTLGGLAIAIGEVVDDAVIDVENIYRRLRLNRAAEHPRPALQVVFEASIEVRSAVVYATFAVILVFIPVLTMSGLAGRLFSPLGVAYILAILASLVVALTVTPALSLLLLASRDLPEQEPRLLRAFKRRYNGALEVVERHSAMVMAAVVVLVLGAVAVVPFLESSFIPDLREGHFIVHMQAVPGTSVGEALRLGDQVTKMLLKNPNVRMVAQRVGRAELAADTPGPQSSEFEVDLKPNAPDSVQSDVRAELEKFPGANFSANTFLTERIDETLSGYTSGVVVNVVGNDLDVLDQEAAEVAATLRQVPGATDVLVQSPPGMPQVSVKLRPEAMARWGFDPLDVLDAVRTAYGGEVTGQVYEGNKVFDTDVILPPKDRSSVSEIGALPLRSPDGNYVPLRELADIQESSGRYIVLHQGARRVQTITCNVKGRGVESFVTAAQKRLATLHLQAGNYVEFAGTAEAQARSRRDLIMHSTLAAFGILLLLSVVMGNTRNLMLVVLNLPFALVGGVLAALATGGMLSLGSLVGFVTLFGITLRNSIMLISHYEHLVSAEGMTWNMETAMRGAGERVVPILMTALVTGLGLLPLALGSGAPGREIEGPMAIVILGGLATSTLLNLLVLPVVAARFGKFEKEGVRY